MKTPTAHTRVALRDYGVMILVLLPMLVVCYVVLETYRYHIGTVVQAGIEADRVQSLNDWVRWCVDMGWIAFNWSFILVLAFAALEFLGSDQWKRALRRAALITCSLVVSTYTTVSSIMLILLLAVDFRVLHHAYHG